MGKDVVQWIAGWLSSWKSKLAWSLNHRSKHFTHEFHYLISQCFDLWLNDHANLLLQLDNQPAIHCTRSRVKERVSIMGLRVSVKLSEFELATLQWTSEPSFDLIAFRARMYFLLHSCQELQTISPLPDKS